MSAGVEGIETVSSFRSNSGGGGGRGGRGRGEGDCLSRELLVRLTSNFDTRWTRFILINTGYELHHENDIFRMSAYIKGILACSVGPLNPS